jgi:replication-associated recombination protein RarA
MGDESKMDVVDADEQAESKYVKNTLPWVEKYRPKSLGELIAHEEIIQILNKLIDSNKLPHLLFYGPPGTGSAELKILCLRIFIFNIPFSSCYRENVDGNGMC